jgi:hypothetical protein
MKHGKCLRHSRQSKHSTKVQTFKDGLRHGDTPMIRMCSRNTRGLMQLDGGTNIYHITMYKTICKD